MIDFPPIMTIDQAAAYLCVSPDTLYKYAATGHIPGFKLGNRWRFRKVDIDQRTVELMEIERKLCTTKS